jgi:tRNA U34 5-carboxymethylaminomethyl modifying GTPase MnmE/TrmE
MAKQEEKKQDIKKQAAPEPPVVAALEPTVSTSHYNSKIEAIKDIIFGEDYAALRLSLKELDEKYAQKLAQLDEKLEHKLATLDDHLSAVIKDLDRTLNHKLDEVEMDLKSEIDRVDHHKADRFKLGQMLEALGRSLQE